MTAPPHGPGDWDAGEGEWIDRVLDRAAERIESGELFDEDALRQPEPVPQDRRGQTRTSGDIAPSMATLSGAISASEFSSGTDIVPGATPMGRVSAQPILALGEPPLTADAVRRSAYTEELSSLALDESSGAGALSWLDDSQSEDPPAADSDIETIAGPVKRGAVREWAPVLILAVVVAVVFRMFLLTAYHIPSLSMAPALDVGDRVVVNRLSYKFGDLDRGQVVVFSRPPGQVGQADHLIKRVIGLPGETVTVSNGHVWIDGRRLSEPYLAQEQSSDPRTAAIPGCADGEASRSECVIPEGWVFVMGDNRRGSVDSRVFGPIEQDTIVGRAFVRIWVLDNIGWL